MKWWITFNEPWIVAWVGYGNGDFAPGVVGPGTSVYVAAHNIIKAHAEAWHTYNDDFRQQQQGNAPSQTSSARYIITFKTWTHFFAQLILLHHCRFSALRHQSQ